jgi:DNA-binding NarL/FixJ family response regulator
MPIRVLIADDHAVFRSGLRVLLEKEMDIKVVAETGNGADTLLALKKNKIDVIVLDLKMPGMPGDKLAQTIVEKHPKLPIVILTMHEEENYLKELFRIGVHAFVLKKSTFTDVLQAIRAVCQGGYYADPSMTGQMIGEFTGRKPEKKNGRIDILTRREKEICSLLAYGHTNAEIAGKLFISERTVETHRNNIMSKLEIKSRAELVRFAISNSLIKVE